MDTMATKPKCAGPPSPKNGGNYYLIILANELVQVKDCRQKYFKQL